MTDHNPRDEWLSVAQAAPVIGVSPSKFRSLIWDGEIAASRDKQGGKFRVRRSECDRYNNKAASAGLIAQPA